MNTSVLYQIVQTPIVVENCNPIHNRVQIMEWKGLNIDKIKVYLQLSIIEACVYFSWFCSDNKCINRVALSGFGSRGNS